MPDPASRALIVDGKMPPGEPRPGFTVGSRHIMQIEVEVREILADGDLLLRTPREWGGHRYWVSSIEQLIAVTKP